MKRKTIFFCLLTALLLACSCPTISLPFLPATPSPTPLPPIPQPGLTAAPPPSISQTEAPFDIAWDDRALFSGNLTSSYQEAITGLPGASIYHIAFSLSDPPTSLTGVEEIRYTNRESVPLSEVDFAIFPAILGGSIDINNIQVDGQPVQTTQANGIMRVQLPQALPIGEAVTFHIEFDVSIPSQGGGYYYGIFGYNNAILSLAHAYPTILVYNEQGWNNQIPDLDGDPLFSDASFYLVSVDAPANLVLVGSGVEVDHSRTTDRQRVLYANGPARDFYLVASSDFVKQSEKVGEITYNSYAPPALDQGAESTLHFAEAAIDDFSRRYAPYPYTEFDIAPIVTAAGGVEFPGMTVVADTVYNDGDFLEIVVVHEVGHQWFYNLVGNATQGQPWLDESMAEFVTWQYYLDQHGTGGAQSYRQELQYTWGMADDPTIPIGQPVSAYTSDGYVGIVYGRGPLFLLALRDTMGKAVFDRFLNNYTRHYAWDIATTDGFKQMAEQECGCDLTPLFDEWVYSK